jgi:oligopeptide/dipeptide ABC transporter ATP-binding protein
LSQVFLDRKLTGGEPGRKPVLQVSGLNVTFRKSGTGIFRRSQYAVNAVRNVSFELEESDALSLVGESGSGKTTIARCVLGLTKPTSGTILVDGKDITKLRGRGLTELHKKVQIVYQDPFESLNPRHDVSTAISIPLRLLLGLRDNSVIDETVRKLLLEVGLDPERVRHRYPHQLSGGERQRVSIARALAPNPRILVADEPVTMLDAEQKLNILSLLQDLQSTRKLALLYITHDLASARLLSRRTLVLFLGKMVEGGDTNRLFMKPRHPYVELIMEAMPQLDKELSDVQKFSKTLIEESLRVSQGCIYRPRCKYATEICASVDPEWFEMETGRYVACHNPRT